MGMNTCGLPEFLAEILIGLIKFWLIMCGILEFRISKSKKRYIAALSVLLIVVFALYVIEFMNPLSLGTLSTLLFGIVITGKKKILWTILSFFSLLFLLSNSILLRFIPFSPPFTIPCISRLVIVVCKGPPALKNAMPSFLPSMVPEFLHVDTNDYTNKPYINIRIVS